MANLLGDLWADGAPDWTPALAEPGLRLHLYGKGQSRPGRKMGHFTVVDADIAQAERRARSVRERLGRQTASRPSAGAPSDPGRVDPNPNPAPSLHPTMERTR